MRLVLRAGAAVRRKDEAMAEIWIEFYRPVVTNGTFTDVMEAVRGIPKADRVRRDPDAIGIFDLRHPPGQPREYVGEAGKIRMTDFPAIVDTTTGDRDDLNIAALQGLSEEIAFVYDGTLDVIAVQRNRMLRASTLKNFLMDLTNSAIDFQPILRQDALERLERIEPQKIKFKVARPLDLQGQRRPSVAGVFQQLEEFDGVTLEVEISVGREYRQHRLNMGRIRQVVEDYLGHSQDFQSLKLTGRVENGDRSERETIDFIEDALRHMEEDVHYNVAGRRLDIASCKNAVRRAISTHKQYLRRIAATR